MSKLVIGLCAFVMLVITPSVQADPIVITSGSLSVSFSGVPNYTMTGLNFSITAGGGDSGNSGPVQCVPCASGTLLNTGSFFVGSSLGRGTVTIDGTTFNNVSFLGSFSLGGTPVLLPAGTSDITLTFPFTFGGVVRGCESSVTCINQVFGDIQLIGQGIGSVSLAFSGIHESGVTLYSFRSLTYTFQSAEIPEPMTITLLATGLLGVAAKLSRRSKSRL